MDKDPADLHTLITNLNMDSISQQELEGLIPVVRDLWIRTQKTCIRRAGVDPEIFYFKSMPQSELFMAEIIPTIHELYFGYPVNRSIDVLDIGPQTFSGTRLLSRTHAPDSFNNLKMNISALDIHDHFKNLKECLCPEVEFFKANIFDVKDRSWDLIICSHVIEHVPDPKVFLDQLKRLSRRDIIVACPWNEDPITTKGHVNTIDKAFVRSVGASSLKIFTNFMWGKSREVCIFTLQGTASHQRK
jgi:2-polyprenyl-3-methyl-5-hydroxy-6-metoxy-1,4-benzoquinol methylase